jgi:hypothetical protein
VRPLREADVPSLREATLGASSAVGSGQRIILRGDGFSAGATIDAFIASDPVFLGSGVASALGAVEVEVTVPFAMEGTHSLVLVERATGTGFRQSVQVIPTQLAVTGGHPLVGVLGAIGVLLAGVSCTLALRRRLGAEQTARPR